MTGRAQIDVCGLRDVKACPGLVLTVSSRAPIFDPLEWKDLWLLSPFSIVQSGLEVSGLTGVRSKTVENAFQFLKVWEGEAGWKEEEAKAAFNSDCAIRYPRGKNPRTKGHYWGETGELLDYVNARIRIYLPPYLQMIEMPDRDLLITKLRAAVMESQAFVWDFDSYRIENVGLRSMFETIFYLKKPFAHAFIVALAVREELQPFQEYVTANLHKKLSHF